MSLRKYRHILIILLTAAALSAIWYYWKTRSSPVIRPQTQAIVWYSEPRALPDFLLQRSDGTPLTPDELKGHWTLVFIGFTFCPDICPTTLMELAQAQKRWEALPEPARPRLLFISADPERDSLDRLDIYTKAFHPDTWAATADIPTLERFVQPLHLVFMKVPRKNFAQNPLDYAIDHSANIAVLDPQGRLAGVIRPPLDAQAIADDLLRLTGETP
ncbi:MAG: SCO family protein [Xanthomonadaceae bacterium]|jgi:protein SCO1/2|nr:SCO family protein [Xanthomonadaceae bacterium]